MKISLRLPHPAFFPLFAALLRRHLLPLTIAVTVLVLAMGGYIGWRYWQFRQTAQYTFEELKAALHPASTEALARLVNFNALGNQLAVAVAQAYPFVRPGPEQHTVLSDLTQTALLRQARIKEDPFKDAMDLPQRLKTPLYVLPQDFYTQLAASLKLQRPGDNVALVRGKVRHPLLDRDFTLLMELERTPEEGWRIRRLINGAQVVQEFRAAQVERMEARRKDVLDKNATVAARFHRDFPIQSCTAEAGILSDNKTLLLVLRVLARNNGTTRINNMNLEAAILGSNGQELLHRQCNAVQPTAPGEDLDHRWTLELDAASPLGRQVRAAGALTCRAAWKTLGLANGEVLHVTDKPALEEELH